MTSLQIMGMALAASVAAIWSCRRLGQPHPKNRSFRPDGNPEAFKEKCGTSSL
jgi:hypothetical protein